MYRQSNPASCDIMNSLSDRRHCNYSTYNEYSDGIPQEDQPTRATNLLMLIAAAISVPRGTFGYQVYTFDHWRFGNGKRLISKDIVVDFDHRKGLY